MTNSMTNYNERLDKLLTNLVNQVAANEQRLLNGNATRKATIDSDSHATTQAKQAITSLIKELVTEAKPPVVDTPSRIKLYADDEGQMWYDRGQNDTIARFEQNLLKALEEK